MSHLQEIADVLADPLPAQHQIDTLKHGVELSVHAVAAEQSVYASQSVGEYRWGMSSKRCETSEDKID